MNLQEQEHWDHEDGCQSELQNAYQRSRMEADLVGDREEIQKWANRGKYVLIYWMPEICPSTDAYLADVPHIDQVYDEYDEAHNAFMELSSELGSEAYVELRYPEKGV